MNYPRPALIRSTATREHEIPSFGQWLLKLAMGVKTLPGAGMVATLATMIYGGAYNLDYVTDEKNVLSITSGAQCVLILIFIFVARFTFIRGFSITGTGAGEAAEAAVAGGSSVCAGAEPQELEAVKADAARALRHYHNYWMALWLSWLLLYAVFTFMHLPTIVNDKELSVALKVGATFLNNCAALSLLYCYLTLSRPELLANPGARREHQADWPVWVAILFILTLVEATLTALASAGRLPDFLTNDPKRVSAFFGWLSGINSSVVMILYIRRLASRFMDCPIWVIVLLSAYAALQPGFGVLGVNNVGGTLLLLNFALVLKILLFIYMTYVFRYGWLLCYFVQVRQFKDTASDRMKSFSQLLE